MHTTPVPTHPRPISRLAVLSLVVISALAGSVVLSAAPAAAATCPAALPQPFTDVPKSHPLCREIANASIAGWVDGYEDGTFQPGTVVSRQAAAAVLSRAYGALIVLCAGGPFIDVPADHPFCTEIASANLLGFVNGYPDGTFRPTEPMTRAQIASAAMMKVPVIGIPPCGEAPFVDVPPDHPLCPMIQLAAEHGVVGGYPDGTFRPGDPVTRGAFVAIVARAEPLWVH